MVWLQSISWCISLGSGLSMLEVWTVVSLLQGGFCVIIGCWGKLFGCFKGNFENTGKMEMFSMPGESDLVDSFMFGQGQIQIPSLACLFESVIWNDQMIYRGKVIWCDLLKLKIYQVKGTVLVSVHILVNKINTYRLKRR